MKFEFESTVIEWRGRAPFFFATTPPSITHELETSAGHLSYGWGCIPVDVNIGNTTFYTVLIPREGTYFVPLKAALRRFEALQLGDHIQVQITVRI